MGLQGQDGLAAYLAAAEGGECLGGLVPSQGEADAGGQAAVGDQCGEDGKVLALGLLGTGAARRSSAARRQPSPFSRGAAVGSR
jgi:hypothetical protein